MRAGAPPLGGDARGGRGGRGVAWPLWRHGSGAGADQPAPNGRPDPASDAGSSHALALTPRGERWAGAGGVLNAPIQRLSCATSACGTTLSRWFDSWRGQARQARAVVAGAAIPGSPLGATPPLKKRPDASLAGARIRAADREVAIRGRGRTATSHAATPREGLTPLDGRRGPTWKPLSGLALKPLPARCRRWWPGEE